MTKEEIKQYRELDEKFNKECNRVARYLVRFNYEYNYVTDWEIYIDHIKEATATSNGEEIHGWGDCYSRGCYMGVENVYFDAELLTYTDEELDNYVNDLIKEKTKEEEEKKRKTEEEKRNKELATLKRLKEKYGNISL